MATPNTPMSPWRRFLGILELEKRDIGHIIYYAVFSGLVSLSLPLGIQAIINLLQGAQITTSWIVLTVLVCVGVLFAGGLQLVQLRIIETIQQRIFTRASFELSYRFPRIRMSELYKYYPPELANRFFDTLTIQKGLSKILIDIPSALLQITFSLALLAFYHPFFIFFSFILALLFYIVFRFTFQKGLTTSLDESKKKYKVAHWIQEIARTIISFKLSSYAQHPLNRNDKLVTKYLKARENHFKIIMRQFVQLIGFKLLITGGLLSIGGVLVLNQQMNIGQFVAAEIIIILIINSVEKLIVSLETVYDVLTSIEKLGQIVDKDLEDEGGQRPDFKDGLWIELQDLSYRVPSRTRPILRGVNLFIRPDSRIIIHGESGSGRSSLLRIIAGILAPTSGSIFVNKNSLQSIDIIHYRQHIGLSLADETPFEGTIEENITMGDKSITPDQIADILPKVGLESFVQDQTKGIYTMLYPEGKQISYSIAKKIVLARAIIRQPKVLILEDPLNQVSDQEADYIIPYLTDAARPWSLIVVSHNTRWQTCCDHVIRLDRGQTDTPPLPKII